MTSLVDKPLPLAWIRPSEHAWEEDDVEKGLQHMKDYIIPGYRIHNTHIHILLLVTLSSPTTPRKERPPPDVPSKALHLLHNILHNLASPSSISPAIPTAERTDRSDSLQEPKYKLWKWSQKLVERCRYGVWDMIIETKGSKRDEEWEAAKLAEVEREKAELARAKERKPFGPSVKAESSKGKQREWEERRPREVDDNEEAVRDQAWGMLDWLVTWWEMDQANNPENVPYSPRLLLQISPTSSSAPRWDVSRPLLIILQCLTAAPSPGCGITRISLRKLGRRLLSLLVNLTLPIPPPLLPSSLPLSLHPNLLSLPLPQLTPFLASLPTQPWQLRARVLADAISALGGVEKRTAMGGRAVVRTRVAGGAGVVRAVEAGGSGAVENGAPAGVTVAKQPYKEVTRSEFVTALLSTMAKVGPLDSRAEKEEKAVRMMVLKSDLMLLLEVAGRGAAGETWDMEKLADGVGRAFKMGDEDGDILMSDGEGREADEKVRSFGKGVVKQTMEVMAQITRGST